jgi:DNA-binding transcriptional MerR regulator
MKTGKAAQMLERDTRTVTNWTDHELFKKFFTMEARGLGVSQRDYTEADILVLNTIRLEREHGTSWEDIAAMLQRGERHTDLPPSALTVQSTAPIAQYGKMAVLQARVEYLEEEMRKRNVQIEEKEEVIGNLREEIGMLKGIIKMMKEQGNNKE